jgi:hypothetical protein
MIRVTILQQEMACLVGTDWTTSLFYRTLCYPGQGEVGFERDMARKEGRQAGIQHRFSGQMPKTATD